MSSPAQKEVKVPIVTGRVGPGKYAATTELAGRPICSYGTTEEEASRKAKGAVLRLLGNILERDEYEVEAIRFKMVDR